MCVCLGGGGGGVDPKKSFWSQAAARKNVCRPSRESGGMLPQKSLKI